MIKYFCDICKKELDGLNRNRNEVFQMRIQVIDLGKSTFMTDVEICEDCRRILVSKDIEYYIRREFLKQDIEKRKGE